MADKGIQMKPPGGKRAVSEAESLAALRNAWNAGYVIPEPRRRLVLWRTWTAWRRDASGQPLTERDAGMLGLAIAEDWATVPLRDRAAYRAGAQ